MNTDCGQTFSAASWHGQTKRTLLGTVSALGFAIAVATGVGASPIVAKPKHHTADKHKSKQTAKDPFANIPSGPLQIFISINQQKLHLYSDGQHVIDVPVATGVPGHLTPMGVFSVIEKDRYHHSNIYSGAPMPYMQRITWSGVALHEGTGLGHPASHGCIRMPHDFAVRLWGLTKLGVRIIIARNELAPVEFSDPHLFVHKEPTATPVAIATPATEPVKTAQAIDPTKATDAAPLRGTLAQPELIDAAVKAAVAAAAASESADAAPAIDATAIDPGMIADGKDVAEGAAAGLETEDAARAAAANTESTSPIATEIPAKAEPAVTEAATIVEATKPVVPEATPVETPKDDAAIAAPAPSTTTDATPTTIQSPKLDVVTGAVPAVAPTEDFAAKLRVPAIINSPEMASRAPAPVPTLAPIAAATALPEIAPLPLDDVPMPEARPANIAKILAERAGPIAVFVSRKEGKIFVRQRFRPVFDAPITIENPEQPLGTHVFTAMAYQSDNASFRWTAVTLPGEPPRMERHTKETMSGKGKHRREVALPAKTVAETKPPQTAHEALARLQIPQDVIDRIDQMIIPGSSLVISDKGLGPETGEGTDFIVVTR